MFTSSKRCFGALVLLVFTGIAGDVQQKTDQFTPVVVSALTPAAEPVLGSDGKQHVVYGLVLTNTNVTTATLQKVNVTTATLQKVNVTTATLQKVEVIDAAHPSHVAAEYAGSELLKRLHATNNALTKDTKIEWNGTRLLLMHLVFDRGTTIPSTLEHRFTLLGAPGPYRQPVTPVALRYTVAPLHLSFKVAEIWPPLAGKGWVAVNGCCEPDGVHRASSLAVNGDIYFAQRFAIDWMLLDSEGRLVHGDSANVHSYPDYGADVLAVADGNVVSTLNSLDDQIPGKLPDPKAMTLENVDGNHIVIDLGSGKFAFYAHLQKNSVLVSPGDHVKRGQILAKLGNTGNTSAPHLHFHVMDGPSVLGSNGLSYVFDSFRLAGQIPLDKFEAATGPEGDWSTALLPKASPRTKQLPMNLAIVDFGEPDGALRPQHSTAK